MRFLPAGRRHRGLFCFVLDLVDPIKEKSPWPVCGWGCGLSALVVKVGLYNAYFFDRGYEAAADQQAELWALCLKRVPLLLGRAVR